MDLKDWLIPQDKIFFEELISQIKLVNKAYQIFSQNLKKGFPSKNSISQIKNLEEKSDLIVSKIFELLNKTFITPIDHEDLGKIVLAGDDLIDLILVISLRWEVYQIKTKEKLMIKLSNLIEKMLEQTENLLLKTPKLNQNLIDPYSKSIHRLENEADELLIKALRQVFLNEDLKKLIQEKEIYELLEVLTDRIEDYSDLIQGIVTKNL